MKIRPVGAELFHTDGGTDRREVANCCFTQFCKSASNRLLVRSAMTPSYLDLKQHRTNLIH